jgi:hypothetical protein
VQWLNIILSIAAGLDFILASWSLVWVVGYVRPTHTRARQVGALVLAFLNLALALEAALFLSQAPASHSWTRSAATAFVRVVLLLAAGSIAGVVWRGMASRR